MASNFQQPVAPPASNGLGTAAMVVGIIALVLSIIPVLGLLSWILAPLAIIFGIIAVTKDHLPKGGAIAGIATGAIAFLICIAWATAFGAAMNAASNQRAFGSSSAAPSNSPPIEVSAKELFRAYQANEARAQDEYGNRPLLVSGTVSGVNLDLFNSPVVLLTTDNEFMSAHAQLTADGQTRAKSLNKGQAVSLLCQSVTEVVGTPMLKDCALR